MTNLKNLRQSKGITQKELSEYADVNIRTLQDYEQGKKPINAASALTVFRLSKALNCEVRDILELDAEQDISND